MFKSVAHLPIRRAVTSTAIKAASVLLGFMIIMASARLMGAADFGQYIFAFTIISLVGMPLAKAMNNIVVRECSKSRALGDSSVYFSAMRWSKRVGAVVAALSFAAVVVAVMLLGLERTLSLPIVLGILLIPLFILILRGSGILRCLGYSSLGQLPDLIVRPLLLLVLMLVGSYYFSLQANNMMLMHVAASVFALFAVTMILRRVEEGRDQAVLDVPGKLPTLMGSYTTLTLLSVGSVANRQADLVLVGIYMNDEWVAIYKVALQLAALVSFALSAVNIVIQPLIVRYYQKKELEKLQDLVSGFAFVLLILAIVAMALLVLFGHSILEVGFGTTYLAGYDALVVLAFAELVNICVGSVVYLLNMTGHEIVTTRTLLLSAALNIVLNIVLIPQWGILGAAISTVVSYSVWNVLLWRSCRKLLGIDPSPLAFLKARFT